MSHSKRNTSLAFFTSYERQELKGHWGSQGARLTRDSFLPFGSCQLCLLSSREPVACPSNGHLFCRECALSNLLAQQAEIKRLKTEGARRKAEDAEVAEGEDEAARQRGVEEFERVQQGLSARTNGITKSKIVGRADGKVTVEEDVIDASKGTKRKFELDEAELMRIAQDERNATKRQLTDEKAAKSSLPSFWVPGLTPDDKSKATNAAKIDKLKPICPASETSKAHDFSLKSLVNVHFNEDKPAKDSRTPQRTCPSCNKTLSNASKAVLAKPCGHVVCKPCSDKFQKVDEDGNKPRCFVCQEDLTPGKKAKKKLDEVSEKHSKHADRGLVELASEGTGFAGGGKNVVKREGVAFQC